MSGILERVEKCCDLSRISHEVKDKHPKMSKVLADSLKIELEEIMQFRDEQGELIHTINTKGGKCRNR